MVDQLSDVRVTLELPQNLLLALQSDSRRMLDHDLFMCRSSARVLSGCGPLMLDGLDAPTWRSILSREASARQHTRLSHPLPPDRSVKAKPWRPLRNLAQNQNKDMNGHAGLAEMKVDSGVIFCSRLIVAAQVLEGGFIGAEALRVAVGAYWIIHWLAD